MDTFESIIDWMNRRKAFMEKLRQYEHVEDLPEDFYDDEPTLSKFVELVCDAITELDTRTRK